MYLTLLYFFAAGAQSKMLVGLDTEISPKSESEWFYARGNDRIAYWDTGRGYDSEGERGGKRMILTGQWRDEKSEVGWIESKLKKCRDRYDENETQRFGWLTLGQCKEKCLAKEDCVAVQWDNGHSIYRAASDESNSCPDKYVPITDYEECKTAANMIRKGISGHGSRKGDWDNVPPYCSYKTRGEDQDKMAFNTNRNGKSKYWTPICKYYKAAYGGTTKTHCTLVKGDCSNLEDWTGGSTYVLDNRVVTDVKTVASDRSGTQCPRGYNRIAYWSNDNDDAWDTEGRHGKGDLALCEKRELCKKGKSYVSKLTAFVSDNEDIPEKMDGAGRIGYWDSENSGGAWSAATRNYGNKMVALYQKKTACPGGASEEQEERKCVRIEIEDLEQVGATTGGLNGYSLKASEEVDNCLLEHDSLNASVKLSAEAGATSSSSYTLKEDFDYYLSTTWGNSVSLGMETGFKSPSGTGGPNASFSMEQTLSLDVTGGWNKSKGWSDTRMYSKSKQIGVVKTASISVGPGRRVEVWTNLNGYSFEAKFRAIAKCYDEDGKYMKSARIEGTFEGQSFVAGGATKTRPLACPKYYKYKLRGSTGTEVVKVNGRQYLLDDSERTFENAGPTVTIEFTNDGRVEGEDRNVFLTRSEGTFELVPVGGDALRKYEEWNGRKLLTNGMYWNGVYEATLDGGSSLSPDLASTLSRRLMSLEQE